MYIRAVQLKEWRSYRNARFSFPRPENGRNVVLIRAPNEYGKTSLFEAIVLALFGRSGLRLLPRANVSAFGELPDRPGVPYGQFLSGALHRSAITDGVPKCSVTLEFESEEGEPIELTRHWHFTISGTHKPRDDELLIFRGEGRRPVSPGGIVIDRDRWYQEYIAQTFIPVSLAEFFLFDGEQVQRLAKREMNQQIRAGVEGLLGLPVIKSLKESLRGYAADRRAGIKSTPDEHLDRVRNEIEALEIKMLDLNGEIEDIDRQLPRLESDADDLLRQIGGRGEGTKAIMTDLIKEENRFRGEAERLTDELIKMLSDDVSLALSGATLRKDTIVQLESEAEKERWESGRAQGSENLNRFAAELSNRLSTLYPPIGAEQRKMVLAAVKEAWALLWNPPPDNCADTFLHVALKGNDRRHAIERLQEINSRSRGELSEKAARRASFVEMAEAKKREWLELEQSGPELLELNDRFRNVNQKIADLRARRNTKDREHKACAGELASRHQELGRHSDSVVRGAPASRWADLADRSADLIEEVLRDAIPTQVQEVANEMTRAWKSMAHMEHRVDRIEISNTCDVTLLNKNGKNINDIEKSAGANQIFTQALIRAITEVSGQDFPFVVDTPLARLSRDHRHGVLKTFLDRKGQVILLSTDEEVVGDKLEAIRERISVAYQLRASNNAGLIVTVVEEDVI